MSEAPPSVRVVERVAAAKDVSPLELECVLAEVVKPKALDALFADRRGDRSSESLVVAFEFCGFTVTVRDDGRVELREGVRNDLAN